MLQLAVIRQQPAFVKERLLVKHFNASEAIDTILSMDDRRKKLQVELETAQAGLNSMAKEIGQLIAKGDRMGAEEKKREVALIKASLSPLQQALDLTDSQLQQMLLSLPNLPAAEVPPGKTPEENELMREGGKIPALSNNALPHWDLAKKYNLIDFEIGNKLTGSGFPLYVKQGARLQRALIQYFLDYNTSARCVIIQEILN
jgi:seryl-tRNA synthetase